jgi:hypothetical protein
MQNIANITDLIAENPSGLLELKDSLSIPEYRDSYGFKLKNTFTIFESGRSHHTHKDWYAFPRTNSLEDLFTVQEKSTGNLLVVFIIETIKENRIYCNLVLKDEAYAKILADKSQHVLQVHQMYSQYFRDHIALNKTLVS